MRTITLSNGTTVEVECLSCALTSGRIEADGGVILETDYFHAHQDVAYPIKGLIIVASKRHIKSFDEFTEAEKVDYMNVLTRLRKAQRQALQIEHVYYFYNEDTTHHFHTWMVPRYDWMYEFGRSVESVRPVLRYARDEMNDTKHVNEVMNAIQLVKAHIHHE